MRQGLGDDCALNQDQCIKIILELYDVKEPQKPKVDASKPADKKKQAPVLPDKPIGNGDYADYYQRIKQMAKDKGMQEGEVTKLLKDR